MSNSNEQHGLILTPEQAKLIDELRSNETSSLLSDPKERFKEGAHPSIGEIQFTVGIDGDKVILDFGHVPICWLRLSAENAKQIANAIIKSVDKIESEV